MFNLIFMLNDFQDEENSYDEKLEDDGNCIIVGICAMEKKSRSRPMTEILTRLEEQFNYIRPIIFDEETILHVSY